MWNIICKALLGHGPCTSGCCATRTFRWVYAWFFSMLLLLQSPVLQPVTEHYTQGTCEGTTLKCEKCCVAWSRRLWELIGRRLGMWLTPWYISLHFCHGQRWSQLSIGNLLHTSKRCLRKNGCDAVWTGRHPTTGDVPDLLVLGMRRYVLSSAGNKLVIGMKHRLKPGIVSNQSSWPSLRAGSVSFCIMLLAP